MTLSLHAPIIIAGGGPQGSRASITRIMGARPAMPRGLRQAEFFRDFSAPGTVLIRGLHSASCLFHHAARQLADCLHVRCSSALLHVPNIGMEIEACGARKPSLWSAKL